jgi:hypothetical protein
VFPLGARVAQHNRIAIGSAARGPGFALLAGVLHHQTVLGPRDPNMATFEAI